MPFDKYLPKIVTFVPSLPTLEASDVIMVGDSIPSDILGARNAGINALLIDRKNNRDKNRRGAIAGNANAAKPG